MIKDNEKFISWVNDIEPRAFYKSDMLNELTEHGFVVSHGDDNESKYCEISLGNSVRRVYVNTWEDDFQAMLHRGLPFFVIDDSHVGDPEYHDGVYAGYSIVNPKDVDLQHLAILGAGYIYRNEESVNHTSIEGGKVIRELAILVANESPGDKYSGRGFAAQANVRAICEALKA